MGKHCVKWRLCREYEGITAKMVTRPLKSVMKFWRPHSLNIQALVVTAVASLSFVDAAPRIAQASIFPQPIRAKLLRTSHEPNFVGSLGHSAKYYLRCIERGGAVTQPIAEQKCVDALIRVQILRTGRVKHGETIDPSMPRFRTRNCIRLMLITIRESWSWLLVVNHG